MLSILNDELKPASGLGVFDDDPEISEDSEWGVLLDEVFRK